MHRPSVALQDRPSILLIEDEPSVSALLSEVLEEEGFAVVQASDIDSGLEQARACGPDLIILDLSSGELDRLGGDCATRYLPLIVILRPGACLDLSRTAPIDALLPGPLDLDLLLEHIWRVGNARLLGAVNGPGDARGGA